MTTDEYPADDGRFTDYTVTAAEPTRDESGWVLGLKDADGFGCSFFAPKPAPAEPKPGDAARLYGKGFGYVVRGLFVNGRRFFYRTEGEQGEADRRAAKDLADQRQYDFEKTGRAAQDVKFAALPEVFRRRIARFRREDPAFRVESEDYEVFCCQQAVLIADTLKTSAAVDAWTALPHDEMVKAVPIDDGHSGNTFAGACALAKAYLDDPDRLTGARQEGGGR